MLDKNLLAPLWQAIIEFDMIKPDDHVLIGLSGGKDSMLMTKLLAEIKKHAPFPFELSAVTIDTGFSGDFPANDLAAYCHGLDMQHHTEHLSLPALIAEQKKGPCYTCAYFRRAATNRLAKEIGATRVALAHHHDDAVETFFMNLTMSGQLKTFLPVTWLSRKELHVIRPMLYYREQQMREWGQKLGIPVYKNPCPYDGHTMRQRAKELLNELESRQSGLYDNLSSAMREAENIELWPRKLTRNEDMQNFKKFWNKN